MTKSAQWPAYLNWYAPAKYDLGTLHPIFWFSLLWQRAEVEKLIQEGFPKARELVQLYQDDPLDIVYYDFCAMHRPVQDVGFPDVEHLARLLNRPSVRAGYEEWSTGPSAIARAHAARIQPGAPRPSTSPSLHDHMIEEWRAAPDPNDAEKRRGLRWVLMQVDMALPHAERMAQVDRLLREREQKLKEAGIRFGPAPTRGDSLTGHIGREQVETWASLRVLDYLDIKLACLLEGAAMPSAAVLGDKLFATLSPLKGKSGGVDLAERVRKHTAPLAERITRPEFLEVFAMQMAALQADQEAKEK